MREWEQKMGTDRVEEEGGIGELYTSARVRRGGRQCESEEGRRQEWKKEGKVEIEERTPRGDMYRMEKHVSEK